MSDAHAAYRELEDAIAHALGPHLADPTQARTVAAVLMPLVWPGETTLIVDRQRYEDLDRRAHDAGSDATAYGIVKRLVLQGKDAEALELLRR